MSPKTTITISAKVRAAYEAMRAEHPGLTLSDFYEQAVTFWLRFADETSFKPLVKHLSTITQQLQTVARPPHHQPGPPGPVGGEDGPRAAPKTTHTRGYPWVARVAHPSVAKTVW